MPRSVSDTSSRVELRIPAAQKAIIARAAALENLDLTGFIMRSVLPEAQAVVERAEHLVLSERDSLMVLELLENPPAPTERLIRAAKAGRIS